MSLKWTKRKPTKPGYYWVTYADSFSIQWISEILSAELWRFKSFECFGPLKMPPKNKARKK